MKANAIIQARMGASRLPGKVLEEIEGHTMLWHVVNRVRMAKLVSGVTVATSQSPLDDTIARYCGLENIPCYRGSEHDVLDRYFQAAKSISAGAIIRITADCPLIDPDVIDKVVGTFMRGGLDYATNTLRYTYPDGLDVEVFSFGALEVAWRNASQPSEREHVTPYLRSNEGFSRQNVEHEDDLSPLGYRWTVDEPTDLEFVRAIYRRFDGQLDFKLSDILDALKHDSSLLAKQGKATSNEGYYKSLLGQAKAGPASPLELTNSRGWLERAKRVIPGCAQTFSKGYTQYVQEVSPVFLKRGKGCQVWDVDDNRYIDYVQGLLPNILGYAHDEVNAAYAAQISDGHSFSLPHPLEVELAERLTRLIPCAEMVRFGKNGSDATAGAVRIARAFTGRQRVTCCGYHGWQDWYIGSTTRNAGVPECVRELTHPFPYNNLAALSEILEKWKGEFAAVIMEPINFTEPMPGYLESVKRLAHDHGAVLVFDEICTGFHFGLGGAQKLLGVTPDLACFGKAMGNGFPISCVVGRTDIMKVCEEAFLSFTFAGEVGAMAAAMKVLDILERTDALARMTAQGRKLQDGLNTFAERSGLKGRIECVGRAAWSQVRFRDAEGKDSLLLRSLFQQEVVRRGILMLVTHNMTAAHDHGAVERSLEAYAGTVKTLADWLSDANPTRFLCGPMIQPVFRVR